MTNLGEEHRRVMGHKNLADAVRTEAATELYVAAVRSGASIESTLAAYSKAACAAGPKAVQRLQETIDQCGYGAPTVERLAGVAPQPHAPGVPVIAVNFGAQVLAVLEQRKRDNGGTLANGAREVEREE